jgi:putative (di)nucleoside polyphosphate hydrolase
MKPEFDAWRWADLDEVPGLAVSFRRPIYEIVASRFAPFARKTAPQLAAE